MCKLLNSFNKYLIFFLLFGFKKWGENKEKNERKES